MPKPICVKCKRFYKPKKNGIFALEQMPKANGAKPGLEDEENWEPYKIWRADLYKCEGCNHEIVDGFSWGPLAEHYEDNFKRWAQFVTYTVNDC
jgi:hypothetical protein